MPHRTHRAKERALSVGPSPLPTVAIRAIMLSEAACRSGAV